MVIAIVACGFVFAWPQDNRATLEADLKSDLVGKTFIIRDFYTGSRLTYGMDGKLKQGSTYPCRLQAGILIQSIIQSIRIKGGDLRIAGSRVGSIYHSATKSFENFVENEKAEIDIHFDKGEPDVSQLRQTLEQVFLTKDEDLKTLVPEIYEGMNPSSGPKLGDGSTAARVTLT